MLQLLEQDDRAMVLSREELEALTGKSERAQKRYDSQAKELDALRIPYLRRTDRTLIVFRRHVDPGERVEAGRVYEPNWSALRVDARKPKRRNGKRAG